MATVVAAPRWSSDESDAAAPAVLAPPPSAVVALGTGRVVDVAESIVTRFHAALRPDGAGDASATLLCISAGPAARHRHGEASLVERAGAFAGPVLLIDDHCAPTWPAAVESVLVWPSPTSTGGMLLAHSARWATELDADLWLTTIVDRSSAGDGVDDLLRTDVLAAALLGRMSRDLRRVGVEASWDVLYGRSPASAIASFVATEHPGLVALEVARPRIWRRELWSTALDVATRTHVPVLVLPPTVPPRPPPAPPHESRPYRALRREVPVPVSPLASPTHRDPKVWFLGSVVALLALISVLGQIDVPYFAVRPGEVTDLAPLVRVDAPVHETAGTVQFVTTRARRVSLLDALRGWLDPDISVVPVELAGAEAERAWFVNREQMEASKATATAVALRSLGHEVVERGGGAAVVALGPRAPGATLLGVGDVVVSIGGHRVQFADDVAAVTRAAAAGTVLAVDYVPSGSADVRSALVQVEDLGDGTVGLGVSVETHAREHDLPFDVTIETADVVGPSAGLAFALSLVELLSPGDLTDGRHVAATGVIDSTGTVSPVGRIHQKIRAARRSGADVVLVPAQQLGDAIRHAGGLRVVGVTSLADAVDVLVSLGGAPVDGFVRALPPAHASGPVAT